MQIRTDQPLSDILWYKIGGVAKYVIDAADRQDVLDALDFIQKNHIKNVFVCGLGSNLIFNDNYFDGVVLRIVPEDTQEHDLRLKEKGTVEAFAGNLLDSVIAFGFSHNLTGLEWAGGLPGTVGAAVRGNVGAYGGEIKDSLLHAEVLVRNQTGNFEMQTIDNRDLNFSYRHSIIKEHPGDMIVVSATFSLSPATQEEVRHARQTYEVHIQQRRDRHPLEYPNCGSVFKNIREKEKIDKVLQVFPDIKEHIEKKWYGKIAAGYLIQRLGLQGYRIGNAQVSDKHALFIVNLGNAKAKDVLDIIDTIQEKFVHTFGFTLEPEVEVVH